MFLYKKKKHREIAFHYVLYEKGEVFIISVQI